MRILFLGDIFARPGRAAVIDAVPDLRARYQLNVVIANCENAAHGFGIMPAMAQALFACGIDVLTSGNHIWDQKQIAAYIAQEHRLLRPVNDSVHAPGNGSVTFTTDSGQRVKVVNVMGRVGLDPHQDPLLALESVLHLGKPKAQNLDAVIVDVHAESTAEKQSLAYAFDGSVTLVIGTHTHVPTADTRILPKGTAFQSDAGMCGQYQSIIGMDVASSMPRLRRMPLRTRLEPAAGTATVCGVIVTTDPATGLAQSITRLAHGGAMARDDVTVHLA